MIFFYLRNRSAITNYFAHTRDVRRGHLCVCSGVRVVQRRNPCPSIQRRRSCCWWVRSAFVSFCAVSFHSSADSSFLSTFASPPLWIQIFVDVLFRAVSTSAEFGRGFGLLASEDLFLAACAQVCSAAHVLFPFISLTLKFCPLFLCWFSVHFWQPC